MIMFIDLNIFRKPHEDLPFEPVSTCLISPPMLKVIRRNNADNYCFYFTKS